jgi:hypothetical protein
VSTADVEGSAIIGAIVRPVKWSEQLSGRGFHSGFIALSAALHGTFWRRISSLLRGSSAQPDTSIFSAA